MKINIDKKAVGQRIKNIRLNKGMTLEEFGKLFKATKSNVNSWEIGNALPNKERLKILCKTFDISLNELLYGSIDEIIENNIDLISQGTSMCLSDIMAICFNFDDFLHSIYKFKNISPLENTDINTILEQIFKSFVDFKIYIDDLIDNLTNDFFNNLIDDTDLTNSINKYMEKENIYYKYNTYETNKSNDNIKYTCIDKNFVRENIEFKYTIKISNLEQLKNFNRDKNNETLESKVYNYNYLKKYYENLNKYQLERFFKKHQNNEYVNKFSKIYTNMDKILQQIQNNKETNPTIIEELENNIRELSKLEKELKKLSDKKEN